MLHGLSENYDDHGGFSLPFVSEPIRGDPCHLWLEKEGTANEREWTRMHGPDWAAPHCRLLVMRSVRIREICGSRKKEPRMARMYTDRLE